ncbi:MAG: hypothetical protein AB8F65_04845 [Woeseiaceae bacterium]
MHDDKHFDWPGQEQPLDDAPSTSAPKNTEVFRHWLARSPQRGRRRSSFDPSLYTWKGYRQWKDGVVSDAKEPKE